jgi:tetratricopeptide (TPR) repeat protein
VSNKKIFSLVVALALLVGVCAPPRALGNRVLYESASGADARPTVNVANDADDDADTSASDDSTPKQKKGNSFARALAAPFRALARLFGGGKKKSEEAKKREQPQPAPVANANDTAANQTATQSQPASQIEERKLPASSAAESNVAASSSIAAPSTVASSAAAPTVVAPKPSESARIVRPNEAEDEQGLKPQIWIPTIEGISKDPLTQGRALLEHGYTQEAIAELSVAASRVGPELVEANNLLGLAYDRMGWHIQAIAAYERALTISPKNPVVIANLGYSLYLANDAKSALKRLKQAAKLMPGVPVIYNNIGVVEASLQNYGEALKYFTIASNEYDAHLRLAEIFESEKRDGDAIKHYEAALRLQPGANAVLERLVVLYERTGRHDKADTARRALGQPKNPQKTTTGGGGG